MCHHPWCRLPTLAEENQVQPSNEAVHPDQNNDDDNGIAHRLHAGLDSDDPLLSLEDQLLRNSRVERFLADADAPITLSAQMFQNREQRKQAQAEIDGIVAGLKFLDKVEERPHLYPQLELDDQLLCGIHWTSEHGYIPSTEKQHSKSKPNPCRSYDTAADVELDEIFKDASGPNLPAETTRDADRAWRGLRSLRRGMQAEFQRFSDMTPKSASPAIRNLRTQFPSSKALADRGTLIYRDVLDGLLPDTLAEIFAFASLSHAVSRILVDRGRMEEAQVLSGVQRWRDCIHDVDERDAFDSLASGMWPSSIGSSTPGERPCSFGPHGGDHRTPFPNGQDDTSSFLQQAAAITSTEMGLFSGNLPDAGQFGIPSVNLEQDVLDVTSLTEQEFNFALLRGLDGSDDIHLARKGCDPKEIAWFCEPGQPIPGYSPLPHSPLMGSCPPKPNPPSSGCPIPPLPPSSSLTRCRHLCEFQITDKISDCAAINLRNTVIFLAVSAFAKDTSEYFYLLSGSGKTVARSRTGSACANERSKTDRRLRRDYFEPLKKTGVGDACFLALLAVAKKFVLLGLLGTEEEVQDYLLTVSKEFLTRGSKQVEFIRWIFGQSTGSPQTSGDTPVQQRKRRNPSNGQTTDGSPASKKQRIFRCEYPGCERAYQSPSGLSKHKKEHAGETRLIIRCDKCSYRSNRRDILRQHFLRQHGADLPLSLQERRRGYV